MDDTPDEKKDQTTPEETETPTDESEPTFIINDHSAKTSTGDEEVPSDVKTLDLIETSIKMNITKIERLKEDAKPLKEMMTSFLDGDEVYAQLTEVAKEASTKKGARRRELLSTENGQELNNKINSIKEDMKEAQDALSHSLREFQRMTGLNEFEGEDGELRQIVYTAKLVRKTNLNKD